MNSQFYQETELILINYLINMHDANVLTKGCKLIYIIICCKSMRVWVRSTGSCLISWIITATNWMWTHKLAYKKKKRKERNNDPPSFINNLHSKVLNQRARAHYGANAQGPSRLLKIITILIKLFLKVIFIAGYILYNRVCDECKSWILKVI